MLFYLSQLEVYWGPFRLFRYVTFRSVMALVSALLWMFIMGPRIFEWLRRKKCQNVIREASEVRELASLHANKCQTVTMGGLAIVSAVVISVLCWSKYNCFVVGALGVGFAISFVGMLDDWKKIKRRNTKGVKSAWKWLVQGISTLVVLYFLLKDVSVGHKIGAFYVPFLKFPLVASLSASLLFLFWFLVLSGTSNAINLTDGIDGLAIGCSITVALTYAIFSYLVGHVQLSHYLNLVYLPGAEELCILCASIVGAGIGFLWYNAHPAEVFMGDTGSLGLGAWIGCVALMTHQAFTLLLVGFVFVAEALSVILQVASFKMFRKRIFKMSPLHHHFELNNLPESKIIVRFWIVSLLCALAGLLTLKLR